MKENRQTNIEVLRVFSMFLIVVMHYIFYGLKHNPGHIYYDVNTLMGMTNYLTMEPLYLLSQVAVNCYVMITGYFLINKIQYRWGGVLRVIVQTFFYSLLFLLSILILKGQVSNIQLQKSIFPIHQWGYWFVTVYMGLLLVAPLLSRIAISLSKRQYQIVLFILFILNFQYLYGSVYAGHRTIMFFSFLFLLAGYLKIYGINPQILKIKRMMFLGIWVLLTILATLVNIKKGQFELIGTSYDGPILFLSIATFIIFVTAKMEHPIFRFIAKLSPFTFGVYLIHTNCFINSGLWSLVPEKYNNPIFIHCIFFCLLIFILCTIADFVRSIIFRVFSVDKLLDKISDKIPQL